MPQTTCDLCHQTDRLHRLEPGDIGNGGDTDILLCDDCYERATGLVAVCQDGCHLNLDHNGECNS